MSEVWLEYVGKYQNGNRVVATYDRPRPENTTHIKRDIFMAIPLKRKGVKFSFPVKIYLGTVSCAHTFPQSNYVQIFVFNKHYEKKSFVVWETIWRITLTITFTKIPNMFCEIKIDVLYLFLCFANFLKENPRHQK